MTYIFGVVLAIFGSLLFSGVWSSCYFPAEYQGVYLMQTQTIGLYGSYLPGITTFSEIIFEADAIPPWGKCHMRRGNNVILKDTSGGEDCMRCFHLMLKSPHVIQIFSEGLGKCYTNEAAANATCPEDKALNGSAFKEIMLYRKQEDATEENMVPHPVLCPIIGKFRFIYSGGQGNLQCNQSISEVYNCPVGNKLIVQFKHCSFPDKELKFQCLGDWQGPEDFRYMALMDISTDTNRVKFRCAVYQEDISGRRVIVALSIDSTCGQLRPDKGYETQILNRYPDKGPPAPVRNIQHCEFPEWFQGEWQDLFVTDNVFTFKNQETLEKITMTCIARDNETAEDRFTVFSSTHCGEESYNCVWLKSRSRNVMELQIGLVPSYNFTTNLCRDQEFEDTLWITQGRTLSSTDNETTTPCPITGNYTGVLPDAAGGLCAKVASDCNNPDIMFYTVTNCLNGSHIYEEREYQCIGSWFDDNGAMFTYTRRKEMEGFQCFSGKVVNNGKEVYIKEAGDSCARRVDILANGMKMVKHASCPELGPNMDINSRYPSIRGPIDMDQNEERTLASDPYWYKEGPDHPNEVKPASIAPDIIVPSSSFTIPATHHLVLILAITISSYLK